MPKLSDQKPASLTLSVDYRLISIILVAVIVGMLAFWRPWQGVSDRTIEVTGQATVSAAPDEYVFYPTYQFTNSDKQASLSELTKKSDELVAKLKELGVAENKIKVNSNGYDYAMYDRGSTPTYSLQLTVTINDKDMSQKVQDYLVGTAPTGGVTPQATFSEAKRTELENTARDQATKDARAKADQSAKNLGFGIGSVKTVNDGVGFGGIGYPNTMEASLDAKSSQLTVMPGENDLHYTVTVTYFVR